MKFEFINEISIDVYNKITILRALSQKVELFFKIREYGTGIQEYYVGIICVAPGFDFFFKERKKYRKSKQILEYSIKLNYAQFENSTDSEIEKMVASSLIDSLGVVEELKIKNFNLNKFREDLILFFEQNGINWQNEANHNFIKTSSGTTNQENDKFDLIYDIKLNIYGFKIFNEVHFAKEFFELLYSVNPTYRPEKIGLYEPLKIPFSIEEAQNLWINSEIVEGFSNGIMFKGQLYKGSITWRQDNLNFIDLTISKELIFAKDGIEQFTDLAKRLFLWLNGVYGYSCFGIDILSGIQVFDFKKCLGGISWMTLFGPPYVEMFGKEVIQTAPCMVEEFEENRFLLLTSDEPVEINLEIQEKIKKHLGEDAFCNIEFSKTSVAMDDLISGCDKSSTERYRSPDLSSYIKDLGKKQKR